MRRATLAILFLFLVLSLVLTYPLTLHLADAVEDLQDALLNVWITAWDGHQLLADPLHLFDANIFFSYPRTLAYSELLLGNGLLAMPITAVTGNPVLAYNLTVLLSFVLSGFGTYLLVLFLTRSRGAGTVAGVIFAFSSYRMTNMAQAQLLTTQWMPFALLALIQLLRLPRARHVGTFVLFFCLQALSSFYYAILLALVVALFGISWVVVRIIENRTDLRCWWATDRRQVRHLLVVAVLCALVILPFAWPYFRVQGELGFERTLADNEPFSASLRQYLMVPTGSVLYGGWLPSDDTPIAGGYPVDALFPGLVALGLSAAALIAGRGRLRWFFLLLAGIALVLSFGPRLYLAPGQPAALEVQLPYAWLYAIVPGFKALRAPARFDALIMLSLAVLAGFGVAALIRPKHDRQRTQPGFWLAVSLLTLVLLESLVWPASLVEPVPVGAEVPPVYRWLADDSSEPILELPMAFAPGGPQLQYQYLSSYHWRTTPDGYSGFVPPKHGQIVYEMERFPSERGISLLQGLGVRDVVIHTERYTPERWQEMKADLSQVKDLALVETFGSDVVYRVQPRDFRAENLRITGYLPPIAAAGEPYTAYAIVVNEGDQSYAVRPTDDLQATATWLLSGASNQSRATGAIPLVVSSDGGAAVIPLSLVAPTAHGDWHLQVGEHDGPLDAWQVEGPVTVGDQGEVDFPVPAQLVTGTYPSTIRTGQSLNVALTWRALGKIDAYYSIYVKLLNKDGIAVAGWDGQLQDGHAPTLLWVPGEYIEDTISITVPEDLVPAQYAIEVGMYRAQDLARCLTLNSDGTPLERVLLGLVEVEK